LSSFYTLSTASLSIAANTVILSPDENELLHITKKPGKTILTIEKRGPSIYVRRTHIMSDFSSLA
jgi:hypothetical protein